jgi:gamma-butyrobetaine dioxygenase
MFHCVEQTKSEGGANLWVDAFHAANILYEENRKSFQVLVQTPVAFRNFTKTTVGQMYNQSRHTLIRLKSDTETTLNLSLTKNAQKILNF